MNKEDLSSPKTPEYSTDTEPRTIVDTELDTSAEIMKSDYLPDYPAESRQTDIAENISDDKGDLDEEEEDIQILHVHADSDDEDDNENDNDNIDEEELCPICLDLLPNFDNGPIPRATRSTQYLAKSKPCNHEYHAFCIQSWSEKANTCPKCRQNFNAIELYSDKDVVEETIKVEDKKFPVEIDDSDFILPMDATELEYMDERNVSVSSNSIHGRRGQGNRHIQPMCVLCDQTATRITGFAICSDCSAGYHLNCLGIMDEESTYWNCPMCDMQQDSNTVTPSSGIRRRRRRQVQSERNSVPSAEAALSSVLHGSSSSSSSMSRSASSTNSRLNARRLIQDFRREIRNNRYSSLGIEPSTRIRSSRTHNRSRRGDTSRSLTASSFERERSVTEDIDYNAIVDATKKYKHDQYLKELENNPPSEESQAWSLLDKMNKETVVDSNSKAAVKTESTPFPVSQTWRTRKINETEDANTVVPKSSTESKLVPDTDTQEQTTSYKRPKRARNRSRVDVQNTVTSYAPSDKNNTNNNTNNNNKKENNDTTVSGIFNSKLPVHSFADHLQALKNTNHHTGISSLTDVSKPPINFQPPADIHKSPRLAQQGLYQFTPFQEKAVLNNEIKQSPNSNSGTTLPPPPPPPLSPPPQQQFQKLYYKPIPQSNYEERTPLIPLSPPDSDSVASSSSPKLTMEALEEHNIQLMRSSSGSHSGSGSANGSNDMNMSETYYSRMNTVDTGSATLEAPISHYHHNADLTYDQKRLIQRLLIRLKLKEFTSRFQDVLKIEANYIKVNQKVSRKTYKIVSKDNNLMSWINKILELKERKNGGGGSGDGMDGANSDKGAQANEINKLIDDLGKYFQGYEDIVDINKEIQTKNEFVRFYSGIIDELIISEINSLVQ
ncbi:hypothetical protein B5S33_g2564 [[Candida] boidinii]|nr:hypothetical protein B5S33_g2564 [[Candida] boidinii]